MTHLTGFCTPGNPPTSHDHCSGSYTRGPAYPDRVVCECGCHHEAETSTLTVYTCEQRSDEWFAARCGLVTASAVGKLVTPRTIKPAANDESRGLVALLASERVTGLVEMTWPTWDMQRGIDAEPHAREAYTKRTGAAVVEAGFMVRQKDGWALGYSPDGLVGEDGLIEIKAPRPKGHLSTVVDGEVPGYHMAQLQAALIVTGRAWIDYVSFCGGMPLWIRRVEPDPRWVAAITEATAAAEAAITEAVATYTAAVDGLPTTERITYDEAELTL